MKFPDSFEFDGEIEDSDGKTIKISIGFDAIIANNGIGAYEWHGCTGFDRGNDYIQKWKVTNVWFGTKEVKFSELEQDFQEQIEKLVEDFANNWTGDDE